MSVSEVKLQERQFLKAPNFAGLKESVAVAPEKVASMDCLLLTWRAKLTETWTI